MKELLREGVMLVTYIYDANLRLKFWLKCLQTAQITWVHIPSLYVSSLQIIVIGESEKNQQMFLVTDPSVCRH